MTGALILLCAGRGTRMRRAVPDKVLALVAGKTVFTRSMEAFIRAGVATHVVIVHRSPAQKRRLQDLLETTEGAKVLNVAWVRGGAERQDSVAAGLSTLPSGGGLVFIHDCARPLVAPEQIRRLAAVARRHGAAVLAHRVTDTIKKSETAPGTPARLRTVDRSQLWAMETPQAFEQGLITRAYAAVRRKGLRITDDTQAVEAAGGRVAVVENTGPNPKVTSPADIALVEFLLAHATT